MNPSISTDTRLTNRSVERAPEDGASASRMADYIVDVVFIALLAAPFLIFEVPASWRDAVLSPDVERPAIVSTANAQSAPTPATRDDYGPE